MRIQLDTHALEALFPEGSEARVELQSAVIANFARKTKDTFIDDQVRAIVKSTVGTTSQYDVEKMVKAELEKQFQNVGSYWNKVYSVKESSEVGNSINKHATAKVRELVEHWKKSGELNIEACLIRIRKEMEDRLEGVTTNELAKLNGTVTTLVRSNINEIVRAELASVLAGNGSIVK